MHPQPYYNLNHSYINSHQQQFDTLNLGHIANRAVFLNESTFCTLASVQAQGQLLTKIYQETNKTPIICLDTNPFDNLDQLAAALSQLVSVPFFILGCDARPGAYHHASVALWPYWLIQQQSQQQYQTPARHQRISFLSGIAKPHRLRLFTNIVPWVNHQDVVVVNRLASHNHVDSDLIPVLEMLPWSNNPEWLDVPVKNTMVIGFSLNHHPAYSACVNITAETVNYNIEKNYNYDSLHFITEKTWKAYRSGCLVINYGIDTLPNTLEQCGFQIWQDYDICGTVDQKIQRIVELFKQPDIFDLYQQHIHIVQHNQQLVMSQQLALHMAKPAMTKLTTLLDSV